jgi:hypothetical protein
MIFSAKWRSSKWNAEPISHRRPESPTVLYELTARKLYTCYKADIYVYVMVMQNINRELCRRLRRADNRIAELQRLHASQWRGFACVLCWQGTATSECGAMV